MSGWTWKVKYYCSKECTLIGAAGEYLVLAILFLFLFPPYTIYYLIKWKNGSKLRNLRNKEMEIKENLCFYCSVKIKELNDGKNICMSCGNIIPFCDLCQKHIFVDEITLQVEPCGHIFHRSEFLDWSEENSVCPKCGEKIELVDYDSD